MRLTFDDIELDIDRYELLRSGQLQHVEPKVFSLLVYLAKNPERVINIDELIEAVWNGRIVSDTTIAGCVKHARKAVGDDGQRQEVIKTVRGRGFRFCKQVHQLKIKAKQTLGGDTSSRQFQSTHTTTSTPPLDFKPSLVVQPFQGLSESQSMTSFCHGLSIALTTVLARIPLLRLSILPSDLDSASNSDLHEVLGAAYVLRGTASAADDHVRIMVQLCDIKTGFFLWSHQFKIPGRLETAHDATVLAIVARLEPQLHRAIYENVRSQTHAPNALELYFQASGILALKGWHHDSFSAASTLLRESWSIAPEFAHASSYLSLVLGLGHRLGLMEGEDNIREEAYRAAEESLNLDSMDSSVLGLAGCALGDLGYSTRATSLLKQAVELNPDNAQAWSALGSVLLSDRRIGDAITHLRKGIKLSPHDSRLSVWGGVLSTALRVSGDLKGAIEQAEMACQRDGRTYMPHVILAAAYFVSKDQRSAKQALDEAYRIKPNLTTTQIAYLVGKTPPKKPSFIEVVLNLKNSAASRKSMHTNGLSIFFALN